MFEQHHQNRVFAILCGITGGMGKYLLIDTTTSTYIVKLAQAGLTAFVCGLLGAAGKSIWDRFVKSKQP
jgi:phage shock protein PspC (stress-responsive transcriptional regulator)